MSTPVTPDDQRSQVAKRFREKLAVEGVKKQTRANTIVEYAKSLPESQLISSVRTVIALHLTPQECHGSDLSLAEGFFQDHRVQLRLDVGYLRLLGVDHSSMEDIWSATEDSSCFPELVLLRSFISLYYATLTTANTFHPILPTPALGVWKTHGQTPDLMGTLPIDTRRQEHKALLAAQESTDTILSELLKMAPWLPLLSQYDDICAHHDFVQIVAVAAATFDFEMRIVDVQETVECRILSGTKSIGVVAPGEPGHLMEMMNWTDRLTRLVDDVVSFETLVRGDTSKEKNAESQSLFFEDLF